jgi:hypothetical protein
MDVESYLELETARALSACMDIALKHEWHLGIFRRMPHWVGVYFSDGKVLVSPLCQGHIDHDGPGFVAAALRRLAEQVKEGENSHGS